MVYEVTIRDSFSAAHHLRGYRGECSRQHGHNWDVEVSLQCPKLDAQGLSVDFRVARKVLRHVLSEVDHRDLNAVEWFRDENPTSENLARHIFQRMADSLPAVRVARVTVHESPSARVSYWE
jgi:6-pyruvoyltetrahydropterin/6-carboxytetrahydropterin synthase